jgi:hypothetical protein
VCQKQNIQLLGCIKTTLSYPICLQTLTNQPNNQLSGVHHEKDLSEVADYEPPGGYCALWRLSFLVSVNIKRQRPKTIALPAMKYFFRADS